MWTPTADWPYPAPATANEESQIPVPDTTQTPTTTDPNRRRLTPDECHELLSQPVVGILSSLTKDGWIHSVPVHFLYRTGEIRVLCGNSSIKAANVDRSGRATLCVEVTNDTERRYVTVEGPARMERPARAKDVKALQEQYSRSDTADWTDSDYAGEAMLVLQPARWIAWSDWD